MLSISENSIIPTDWECVFLAGIGGGGLFGDEFEGNLDNINSV